MRIVVNGRRHHRIQSGTSPAPPGGTGRPRCDTLVRDIVPIVLEELLGTTGIDNKTPSCVRRQQLAPPGFLQLKIYGHEDVRIIDGGRKKWLAEGRDPAPTIRPSGEDV